MIITASGEGCFKIQTGGVTILFEGPDNEKTRMRPDIFIRTSAAETALPDAGFIIKGPGEYELKNIEIRGFAPFIYRIQTEGLRLCYLSSSDMRLLDHCTAIDIILLPSNHTTAAVLRQLAPRMIITTPLTAHDVIKTLGVKAENVDKVTIKKRDLPADELTFICLTP